MSAQTLHSCTYASPVYHTHSNASLFYDHVTFMCCTDPPEFTVLRQNVTRNAARNEPFTFDCTPSGGNPAVYSYAFLKDSVSVTEGVSGSTLTTNPVVRSSRGMYTCTANNTAGTTVVTRNLFVVGELRVQRVATYKCILICLSSPVCNTSTHRCPHGATEPQSGKPHALLSHPPVGPSL